MTLVLTYLKPLLLFFALIGIGRCRPCVRGSRLSGIFLSLGLFTVILLLYSLLQAAGVSAFLDVNVEPMNASFLFEAAAYLVLLACGAAIFRNYQRSFVSWGEKALMGLLLLVALALVAAVFHHLNYYFGLNPYTVRSSFLIGMGCFLAATLLPTYVNYFGTRFFFSWCRIGGALLLLTAVNYLQMVVETRSLGPLLIPLTEFVRAFAYWFLAFGFFTYARAHRRLALPAHKFAGREAYSEREQLEQVFVYFVESLFSLYGSVYGRRNRRGLEKKWNDLAAKEGEALRVADGRLENVRGPVELLRQAGRLQRFFDLTRGLLVHYCGEPFVDKMLGQLCQELYWSEKELADNHLFSRLEWGSRYLTVPAEKEATLEELLRGLPIFYGVSEEERNILKERFKRRTIRNGRTIIREGNKGERFYLIATGECSVWKRRGWRRIRVARLRRGDFFGEKALLENTLRTATLKAETDVVVYTLLKEDFLQILKTHFSLLQKMEQFEQRIDFLAEIPLFALFSKMQLLYMASAMRPRRFQPGATVVRQGDPGESFFVIEEGETEVSVVAAEGNSKTIARLGRGEYFGEMALIAAGGRVATVTAATDLLCLELLKADFDRLFTGCDYNRDRLERLILRRKEDLSKKLK